MDFSFWNVTNHSHVVKTRQRVESWLVVSMRERNAYSVINIIKGEDSLPALCSFGNNNRLHDHRFFINEWSFVNPRRVRRIRTVGRVEHGSFLVWVFDDYISCFVIIFENRIQKPHDFPGGHVAGVFTVANNHGLHRRVQSALEKSVILRSVLCGRFRSVGRVINNSVGIRDFLCFSRFRYGDNASVCVERDDWCAWLFKSRQRSPNKRRNVFGSECHGFHR